MQVIGLLETTPWLYMTTCVLIGLCVGSFLNVVIHRMPRIMETRWRAECAELNNQELPAGERFNLYVPRSRCPACAHTITALENIPLLSYALLRGRCRGCHAPISWQYPLVEALTGAVFALCAWRFGWSPQLLVSLVVAASLVALSGIDLRTQLLPDQITLPLLWFALLASVIGWTLPPSNAILGAAVGYLSLWSVYWLFKLATGKEGMGYGDFKLLAALGALVGAMGVLPIVLIASFVGAVIGVAQIVIQGRDRATPIPFGPYLATAGFIQILFGKALLSGWNAWFGLG